LARGIAKKFSGQIKGEIKPFSQHVRDFCSRADSVICSSVEQQSLICQINSNVHVILDSHEEIPLQPPSLESAFKDLGKLILWEGQPATIRGVAHIAKVLEDLVITQNVHLNFVTDVNYYKVLGKYLKADTHKLLKKDLVNVIDKVNLSPWSLKTLVEAANKSDLAMIPIDLTVPMQSLKPENRLLIMWRLGLPCLTSPSASYVRVSQDSGVTAACDTIEKWIENFHLYLTDKKFSYEQVMLGQSYLRRNHNKEIILDKWDRAIYSVVN
jgi:hypothetical protein